MRKAAGRKGESSKAPLHMMQAVMAVELYRASSGFWINPITAAESAAKRMSKAPKPKCTPTGLHRAMTAIPPKLIVIPSHPMGPSRSPRNNTESRAANTGMQLMMRLAAPALAVSSPVLRKRL